MVDVRFQAKPALFGAKGPRYPIGGVLLVFLVCAVLHGGWDSPSPWSAARCWQVVVTLATLIYGLVWFWFTRRPRKVTVTVETGTWVWSLSWSSEINR